MCVLTSTSKRVEPYPCHSLMRLMYFFMASSCSIPCSLRHFSTKQLISPAFSSCSHASMAAGPSTWRCRPNDPRKLRLSVPSRKLPLFFSVDGVALPFPDAKVRAHCCTRARRRPIGNTCSNSGKAFWVEKSPNRYCKRRAARNCSVSSGAGY